MPKALQSLSSLLFNYPLKKEVFEDRFDRSIIIYNIINNKVFNTRL